MDKRHLKARCQKMEVNHPLNLTRLRIQSRYLEIDSLTPLEDARLNLEIDSLTPLKDARLNL